MPLDHWLAFVLASALMLAIPGPTVLLIVSYALSYGRRPAFAAVAGIGLGGLTAITASLLGLGTLLLASSSAFAVLRWIGGGYLVFLGIKLLRAPIRNSALTEAPPGIGPSRMFAHAFAVTALNPKGIIFFVVFLPQFVVSTEPFWQQAAILISTFVVMDVANAMLFALLAAAARHRLQKPRIQKIVNRTGGSLLIGAGALAAVWRKAGG